MNFTDELKRRRQIGTEETRTQIDDLFLKDHERTAAKVSAVMHLHLKGLTQNTIDKQAWQIVGDFVKYMETGGFCRRNEKPQKGERSFLHLRRMTKKDFQSTDSNLKKALKGLESLCSDPGAWDEFQRKLWSYVKEDDAEITRPDLFTLQALSGLEMISKAIEEIKNEGNMFKRNAWVLKNVRRMIIQRLAFLFEWSKYPDIVPDTISALQNFLSTMTKTDDWGHGKETNPGNLFINFAQDVFEALGYTNESSLTSISGATIRNDIQDRIKELNETSIISSRKKRAKT